MARPSSCERGKIELSELVVLIKRGARQEGKRERGGCGRGACAALAVKRADTRPIFQRGVAPLSKRCALPRASSHHRCSEACTQARGQQQQRRGARAAQGRPRSADGLARSPLSSPANRSSRHRGLSFVFSLPSFLLVA